MNQNNMLNTQSWYIIIRMQCETLQEQLGAATYTLSVNLYFIPMGCFYTTM